MARHSRWSCEGKQLSFHPTGVLVGTYSGPAFDTPMVNNAGEIALRVSIVDKRGSSLEPYGNVLLLVEPDGTYSKVAESSLPAPLRTAVVSCTQ